MKTVVYQLGTRKEYVYMLPPEKAVVHAYYQVAKGNFNWWEYNYELVRYSVTARTVYCGDFVAKAK